MTLAPVRGEKLLDVLLGLLRSSRSKTYSDSAAQLSDHRLQAAESPPASTAARLNV